MRQREIKQLQSKKFRGACQKMGTEHLKILPRVTPAPKPGNQHIHSASAEAPIQAPVPQPRADLGPKHDSLEASLQGLTVPLPRFHTDCTNRT